MRLPYVRQAESIPALLTSDAARSLGLSRNAEAFALVRATSVIALFEFDYSKVSARNCVAGKVVFLIRLVALKTAVAGLPGKSPSRSNCLPSRSMASDGVWNIADCVLCVHDVEACISERSARVG